MPRGPGGRRDAIFLVVDQVVVIDELVVPDAVRGGGRAHATSPTRRNPIRASPVSSLTEATGKPAGGAPRRISSTRVSAATDPRCGSTSGARPSIHSTIRS